MAQALYRKWRSQTFEDVIGQEHVTLTLRNAVRDGHLSHAYLFTGVRGTGKTSTARILAKAINCLDPDPAARPCNHCAICNAITEGRQLDLIEIDAASNRGIDEIRDLREKIGFRPTEARYKVYIIDEVHMLTKEAFNALLKTLEEPPPHAIFVLATTEPDRVPETVRSRCQRFDFRRIPTAEIVEHLTTILAAEGKKAAPEALVAIARRATGSMRDAISLLDQLLSYGDEVLSLERVESVLGLVAGQEISRLIDHLVAKDAAAGLALIARLVADGVELGQLADQIVTYLRAVLFLQVTRAPELLELPAEIAAAAVRQADALTPAAALGALREFVEARAALRDQVPGVPQLPLELAFLRAVSPASPSAGPVEAAAQPAGHAMAPVGPVPAPAPPARGRPAPVSSAPPTPARTTEGRPAATAQVVVEQVSGAAESHADAGLLQLARGTWNQFLLLAGKRCGMKIQAALRSVRGLDVVGQTIVLQFSHAFARDLVNQGENRAQVEALWGELLNRPVQVRGSLVGESQAPAEQPPDTAGDGEDPFLRGARELGAVVKRLD